MEDAAAALPLPRRRLHPEDAAAALPLPRRRLHPEDAAAALPLPRRRLHPEDAAAALPLPRRRRRLHPDPDPDLRESIALGDRKDALLPSPSRLKLPASIEYLRDSIQGALGLPAPDRSKLFACLQEHISDLQEERHSHLLQHVNKLKEDLHAAALRIHHLEEESAMNSRRCVQEKEALEEALHAATLRIHQLQEESAMNSRRCVQEKEALEEDLHAATLRIHQLEEESAMNSRRCVQEKEALEEDLHAATLRIHQLEMDARRCVEEKEAPEEDLHAATLRIHQLKMDARRCVEEEEALEEQHDAKLEEDLRVHHLEVSPLLCSRDKAKLERNKRKEDRETKKCPYILSQRATLPSEMGKKLEEKVQAIPSSGIPLYVKQLTKSCIDGGSKSGRSLVFSREFSKKLSTKREKMFLELEDETKLWPIMFNRGQDGTTGFIYKGWTEFFRDNKLKEGDLCLFQLKERRSCVLTVYLIRRPESQL